MTLGEIKRLGELQLEARGVPSPQYRITAKTNAVVWNRGRLLSSFRVKTSCLQRTIKNLKRDHGIDPYHPDGITVEVSEYGNGEWRIIPQDTVDFPLGQLNENG